MAAAEKLGEKPLDHLRFHDDSGPAAGCAKVAVGAIEIAQRCALQHNEFNRVKR